MRRRICSGTGLGNPDPEIFNNQYTDNEEFNSEVNKFFDDILKNVKEFKEIEGFDFSIHLRDDGFRIIFGVEPSYMYDPYICYCFDSDISNSYIQRGVAKGYYGSDIVFTETNHSSNRSFVKCMKSHHNELMRCLSLS